MTEKHILEIEPNFQKLINCVKINNTSKTFIYWHELWSSTLKPLNDQLGICGYKAKDIRLIDAYEDMVMILEGYTTLK